jgi:hypothetical protein
MIDLKKYDQELAALTKIHKQLVFSLSKENPLTN